MQFTLVDNRFEPILEGVTTMFVINMQQALVDVIELQGWEVDQPSLQTRISDENYLQGVHN